MTWPVVFRDIPDHLYTGYAQDEWKAITRAFTLNLGLRVDYQTMAWDEWVTQSRYPRAAIRWSTSRAAAASRSGSRASASPGTVAGNGRSVARGGFGTAYQVFFNGNQGNELVALLQNNINITNPSYPDPFGGRDPVTFISTAPPNVGIMANDLRNAPTRTEQRGFSQQLDGRTSAINVDGVVQHTSRPAGDLPTSISRSRRPARARSPEWGQITMVKTIGSYDCKRAAGSPGETTVAPLSVRRWPYAVEAGHRLRVGLIADAYARSGRGIRRAATAGMQLVAEQRRSASGGRRRGCDFQLPRRRRRFNALAGIDLNNDGSSTTDFVARHAPRSGQSRHRGDAHGGQRVSRVADPEPARRFPSRRLTAASVQQGSTCARRRASASLSSRKIELVGQVFNLFGCGQPWRHRRQPGRPMPRRRHSVRSRPRRRGSGARWRFDIYGDSVSVIGGSGIRGRMH